MDLLKSTILWVKVPNLPMELWTPKYFRDIGNTLGSYIAVDDNYEKATYQSVGRILVDLDLSQGLFETMEIKVGNLTHA